LYHNKCLYSTTIILQYCVTISTQNPPSQASSATINRNPILAFWYPKTGGGEGSHAVAVFGYRTDVITNPYTIYDYLYVADGWGGYGYVAYNQTTFNTTYGVSLWKNW